MTDTPEQEGKKFQWKWVWITVGMFAVFYVLPVVVFSSFRLSFSDKIIGGWSFGGIVVIAAVSAMLSKGVTIWEPAIGGGLMALGWYGVINLITMSDGHPLRLEIGEAIVATVAVFGLSLLGAGLGEGIQNVWKKEGKPEES